MSDRELLEEINSAIKTVLIGGQSYKIGSRQLTRADLSELRKMKTELEAKIAEEDNSDLFSNTYVAYFERR